jgi:hypothetical protein
MLTINTRNDKLAAAQVNFSSRGMLHGSCLGEILHLWRNIGADTSDDDNNNNNTSGPDGNGEDGNDLDIDTDNNDDNGAPGPVDGPSVLSDVALAQKKGTVQFLTFYYI